MNNKINKIFSLIERMEHRPLGSLLNESQESTSQKEAIRYIEQNKGWSHEKADNFVRVTLRHDIPSLRDRKIAKFTLGVTRMFFDDEINEHNISDINKTLKLMSAHLNEYDRNLNGLSAQELIDRFKQVRLDNANTERAEIDAMDFSYGSNYTIVPINSFEEAEKYYEYTNPDSRWCLTYMEEMFDDYTCDGMNQIYFCLQNGFENVPRQVGDKAPLDEYGLSMLSIIVNEDGGLAYCTTRWNHKNGGSDSAMSAKEVSQVVGVNFYNTFKPNNKWTNIIETVKQRLANGESPKDVFDYVGDFDEGFARIRLNDKFNFINQEGKLISNQWFDYVNNFEDGFARVRLNGERYRLDTSGRLYNINENKEYKINKNMLKKKIRLTENELKQIVAESVKKMLNETDYHRAYSSAKKLDGFGLKDTITDDEVFECLDTLQKKLEQERKNASIGQFSGNGESINFLVASIRGLQAFIKSRY